MEPSEIGISHPEEPGKNIEKGVSRETVVKAFNFLSNRIETIPDDPARPEIAWIKKSIKDAHDKTDLENGKDTFTSNFENHHTGEQLTQKEGIPTDLLLQLIAEEIKKVPKGSDEWKQLRENARIIYRSSKRFSELPHRMEPSRYEGRIHQEALWISEDPDRKTGTPDGDWSKAKDIINHRLELVLPTHKRSNRKSPIPGTIPPTQPGAQPEPNIGTSTPPDNGPQVQPQTVEQIQREFVIARQDPDIRKGAREQAELQLRSEMRRGSALNPLNWPRKIGLRIVEQYWRQRLIQQTEKAMQKDNNPLAILETDKNSIHFTDLFRHNIKNLHIDTNNLREKEKNEVQATVEHIKRDESERVYGERVEEAQGALKEMMIDQIIRPIIDGNITTQVQVQDKLREFVRTHENDLQVQAIFGRDATKYGKLADYFASDLLETAEIIRQDLTTHKYAAEQLNEIVKIQLANVDWAAETEINVNRVDRAVAWAESHRMTGVLINPATIGALFSLGWYGGMRVAGIGGRAMQVSVPLAGLLPGALFAGFRRSYDLKVDNASQQIDVAYNKQIPKKEAPRRKALENYAYSITSVTALLNGNRVEPENEKLRQKEVLIGNDRRGLRELMQLDLSNGQDTNREAVIRRIAEIKTRLDFSAQQSLDLISFGGRGQVQQERLELSKVMAEARIKLKNAGMDETAISTQETQFIGGWNQAFTKNREQQDKSFAGYKLKQSLKAGAFGGVVGLGAGFLTQEVWAGVGRGIFHQNLGSTVIEQMPGAKGIMEFLHIPTAGQPGLGKEVFQQLYEHPGNLRIGEYTLAVNGQDPLRSAGLLDGNGNRIPTPPIHVTPDGNLVVSGTLDNLPEPFKNLAHPNLDTNYNIHEDIKNMIETHRSGVFQHGNTIVSIDTVQNTFSMQDWPSKTEIFGTLNSDGSFNIDPNSPANKGLNVKNWNDIQDRLITEAWKLEKITPTAGSGSTTVVDALFNQSPDILKAKGIIETDQFNKQWNFHVLRPDIVDATGNHTHNELTLHLGGKFQVSTGEFRTGSALPGELNFGGDIKGDLIPSNLPGVPAQHDAVLDAMIAKNGAISHDNMLFAVDLTNGKQIMIPADINGNAKLPQELYDLNTGGLRGVKSIASVILEKSDGTILKAGELANTGQIPQGTVVHSLASEKFLEVTPPPADIIHLVPPDATEIDFPPTVFESPPIIPIPFAPRHPLEEIERKRIIYYPGGEPSPEEIAEYERRRSPRLNSNPQAQLNANQEAEWYFDQQPAEYRQELETMNTTLEPMSDECRVAVCIAAASHQEGANIYKTLLEYTDQREENGSLINPNTFEIMVFLNRPDGTTPDNTAKEVARFQREHPEIKVRAIEKVFSSRQPMGVISKYVADMALLRASKRPVSQNSDLILTTNDADADLISKGYIRAIISEYDDPQKKHVDAVLGKIEWNPESYIQYPGFHVANRFIHYMDASMRHGGDRRVIGSSGANFTMKASIYAAIGGYIKDSDAGQDVDLSKMIRDARKPKGGRLTKENYPLDYSGGAWLVTNPRRGMSYYTTYNKDDPNTNRRRRNSAIVYQWSDFSDRHGVRETSWLAQQAQPETIDTMNIQHLEDDINAAIDAYGLSVDSEVVKRILGQFMHMEYTIVEEQNSDGTTTKEIKITDISKIQDELREYKAKNKDKINNLKNQRITHSQIIPPQTPPAQPTPTTNQLTNIQNQINAIAKQMVTAPANTQARVARTLQSLASKYQKLIQHNTIN